MARRPTPVRSTPRRPGRKSASGRQPRRRKTVRAIRSRLPAGAASRPRIDIRTLPGPETITRSELPNGVTVLARENFSSPSVVLTGYIMAGSLDEKPEQAGLADLAASALLRGTARWSFNEVYQQIESVGASLAIGSSKHVTSFQGKALAEDLGLLLGLLSEALLHPTFPELQVERLKGEKLTGLAIRDQDTGARAGMAFDELIYPDHPYRVPDDGYPETVEPLTSEDLRLFHGRHYGPRGMIAAVVGAVEATAAVDAVQEHLGTWTNPGYSAPPELPTLQLPQGLLRREVHLPGKSQCDVVLGSPGPRRTDPDYLAAALGNNILGRFGLYGRIGDAVRESAGLAYYAYSSIGGGPGPDPWQVNAGVNPANVDRAIDLIRREIGRFITRRVTEEELDENQAHFTGRLPLQLESNEGVAGALVHLERFGLGLDFYQRYAGLVETITRDQILKVGRRFLDPDRLAVAVAGPVGTGG
jgi:zinc protease